MQHNNFIAVTDGHQKKEAMPKQLRQHTGRRRTARKISGRFTATTSWRNFPRPMKRSSCEGATCSFHTRTEEVPSWSWCRANHTNNYVFERWWAMKKTQQEYRKKTDIQSSFENGDLYILYSWFLVNDLNGGNYIGFLGCITLVFRIPAEKAFYEVPNWHPSRSSLDDCRYDSSPTFMILQRTFNNRFRWV